MYRFRVTTSRESWEHFQGHGRSSRYLLLLSLVDCNIENQLANSKEIHEDSYFP